jgi:sulfite reductase (NADPH) hemoprotein beta-component
MDELEDRGYGDMAESIGITGCERQCFRPATKTLGWVGSGGDNYALKLGGSEDGSTQGHYLTDGESQFLSMVPRDRVADVCAALFDWYLAEKQGSNGTSEKMGPFIHRQGYAAVIEKLRVDDRTADLLEKRNPPMVFDPYIEKELVDT